MPHIRLQLPWAIQVAGACAVSTAGERELTLSQYIRRRNGLPAGARGSVRNMLDRSLGAGSFAGFWRHWNPVFGYGLGRYVFTPLRRVFPSSIAVVATFVVSGAIHDLVTPWFFFLGLGVLGGRAARMDFSDQPWLTRAAVNTAYVITCLAAVLSLKALYRAWF
jgi:D-alanyl-lipoteichoic acid acyltransferase DltB (MBOAT superfamily)